MFYQIFKIKNTVYPKIDKSNEISYFGKDDCRYMTPIKDIQWNQIVGLKDYACVVESESFHLFDIDSNGKILSKNEFKSFGSENEIIKVFSSTEHNYLFILSNDLSLNIFNVKHKEISNILKIENIKNVHMGNKYHILEQPKNTYLIITINDSNNVIISKTPLNGLAHYCHCHDNILIVKKVYNDLDIYNINQKENTIHINFSHSIDLRPDLRPFYNDSNSKCIAFLSKGNFVGVLFYENLQKMFYYQLNGKDTQQILLTENGVFYLKKNNELHVGNLFKILKK